MAIFNSYVKLPEGIYTHMMIEHAIFYPVTHKHRGRCGPPNCPRIGGMQARPLRLQHWGGSGHSLRWSRQSDWFQQIGVIWVCLKIVYP